MTRNDPRRDPAPAGDRARTAVITGASSGIGAAAAELFAGTGAEVVVVGRSPQRTRDVAARVGGTAMLADFGRLESVRELAADLLEHCPRIDVLANNAGGIWARRQLTADGFEHTIQVNHLAPFLLTQLLGQRLRESSARVIATSSVAHRFGRLPRADLQAAFRRRPRAAMSAYGRSKLANILHMRELQRRSGPALAAMPFHPGLVASRFGGDGALTSQAYRIPALRSRMTTPEQAAARLLWLASAPFQGPGAPRPGEYHDGSAGRAAPGRCSRAARDQVLARRLWEASEAAVGL